MTDVRHEQQFYSKHYGDGLVLDTPYDERVTWERFFAPGRRYHLVERMLKEYRGRQELLVEVGCGQADTLRYISDKHSFGRVVGIDLAIPASTIHAGVEFLPSNINVGLPFEDGSVDVLIAMMVIEHLFDPFFAFGEIKRTLSPSGLVFVNLPLVTSVRNRWRLLLGKLPTTSVGFHAWFRMKEWDGNHLHYFSIDAIKALAAATGLEARSFAGVGRYEALKSMFPGLLAGEITFVLRHAR